MSDLSSHRIPTEKSTEFLPENPNCIVVKRKVFWRSKQIQAHRNTGDIVFEILHSCWSD